MSAKTPQVRRRSRSRARDSVAPPQSPDQSFDSLNLSMQSIGESSGRSEQEIQVVLQNKQDLRQLNERFSQYLRIQKEKDAGEGGWQLRYNDLYESYHRDMNEVRQEALNKLHAMTITNRSLLDQLSDLKSTTALLESQLKDVASENEHAAGIIQTLEEQCDQYKKSLKDLRAELDQNRTSSDQSQLYHDNVRLEAELKKLYREQDLIREESSQYLAEKQQLSHKLDEAHAQARKAQEKAKEYEQILSQHGLLPDSPAPRRSRGRKSLGVRASPDEDYEQYKRSIEVEIEQRYDDKLQELSRTNRLEVDQLYQEFKNDLTYYKKSLLDSARRLKDATDLADEKERKITTLVILRDKLTKQVDDLTQELDDLKGDSDQTVATLREQLDDALDEKNYFAELCKQKDTDFELLMNVKLTLQAELKHYERLLSFEEQRLGIVGLAAQLPENVAITDKSIPVSVKKSMLQHLGIDPEYANTDYAREINTHDDSHVGPVVESPDEGATTKKSSSSSSFFGSLVNLFTANTPSEPVPTPSPEDDGEEDPEEQEDEDSSAMGDVQPAQPSPPAKQTKPNKKRTRGTNFVDEDFLDGDASVATDDDVTPHPIITEPEPQPKQKRRRNAPRNKPIPAVDDHVELEQPQQPLPPQSTSLLVSGRDDRGQYIQIINGADEEVDLSNWYLYTHGREFKFIFPEGAILPAKGLFTLRTVTGDDVDENVFEPDENNNVTIYVTHELWTDSDDKCSLFSRNDKVKAEVRVAQLSQQHVNTQPDGCSIM